MSKPSPNAAELRAREKRAREWRQFRRSSLFTQSKLAEALGCSLRTVQSVEYARVTPSYKTQRAFLAVQAKFGKKAA